MVKNYSIPDTIYNIINGNERTPIGNEFLEKINPHNGQILTRFPKSKTLDVDEAVESAASAFPDWSTLSPVKRGEVLFQIAEKMKEEAEQIAYYVHLDTGKSLKDALGETNGSIQLAYFMAGEGQRFYGKSTTSSVQNKYPLIIREPVGIAGLIMAFNTPIANLTWKVFPALICGNTVIIKPSEDIPLTTWYFGKLLNESLLPKGVCNIIYGLGTEAGDSLVKHKKVNLISFTGSTIVGKNIAKIAGERLAKIFLELGGKNPLVVCDDADLENAVKWVILSAFSNAGQRCAACSRVIVFESVYVTFKGMLLDATKELKIGNNDTDDFGPIINFKQIDNMLKEIRNAELEGAQIIHGGHRLDDDEHKRGFYLQPTIIENASPEQSISKTELFGPITVLYRVKNFAEALCLANNSPYGLTASIHTRDINKATEFTRKVQAGVAVINGGTYGSEPNMPFGGVKDSGNGWREPGTEALDVYSSYKNIITLSYPEKIY